MTELTNYMCSKSSECNLDTSEIGINEQSDKTKKNDNIKTFQIYYSQLKLNVLFWKETGALGVNPRGELKSRPTSHNVLHQKVI